MQGVHPRWGPEGCGWQQHQQQPQQRGHCRSQNLGSLVSGGSWYVQEPVSAVLPLLLLLCQGLWQVWAGGFAPATALPAGRCCLPLDAQQGQKPQATREQLQQHPLHLLLLGTLVQASC
jgi:hypothetical protein